MDAASIRALEITGNDVEVCGLEICSNGQAASNGMYGVNVHGDRAYVHDIYVHDIHASAVVFRGQDCVAERVIAVDVGWDMGLCIGGASCVFRRCESYNNGRSVVACDSDTVDMQAVGCYAYNPGNTRYTDQHHNVFHFEDCNGMLVKDCTVYYDGNHDFCSNSDPTLKAVIARANSGQPALVDGLTVIVKETFVCRDLTGWALILDYGPRDRTPLRVENVQVLNYTDEIFRQSLQVADQEWRNVYIRGGIEVTQAGAASSIISMENVHIDGRGLQFDFYSPQYGYDPNGVVHGCTFTNIAGWVLSGRFDNWKIVHNVFRNVRGVKLLAAKNNPDRLSRNTLIQSNVFEDCGDLLAFDDGTSALIHGNMFYDNTIIGDAERIRVGPPSEANIYWRQAN
jgi:hypothetical protein